GEIIHIDDFAHQKISSLGLNEQRVEVQVKISDKNILLKDGYGADVIFDTFHKENILAINKTSYFEEAGKFYVWKIEGNKATKSEILLGYIGSHKVEVAEGLAENDRIVSDPNNKFLANGVRVKIKS
ncbi:MAG: transporter, partial [Peptostreptococcaceae bacterium]|nr:transporter [Peptostreptococcaceae bacterium]